MCATTSNPDLGHQWLRRRWYTVAAACSAPSAPSETLNNGFPLAPPRRTCLSPFGNEQSKQKGVGASRDVPKCAIRFRPQATCIRGSERSWMHGLPRPTPDTSTSRATIAGQSGSEPKTRSVQIRRRTSARLRWSSAASLTAQPSLIARRPGLPLLMFVETQRSHLFVSAFGKGDRTALALGGWIGSGEMWLPVLGRLSQTWRTVTFDQRGSGASHVSNRDITREAWVDDVIAVMDAQGIERCLVMSDSSGCFPAVLAALKYPERFTGLVLVGGALRMPLDRERQLFALGLRVARRPILREFARRCLPEDEAGHVRRWLWDICVRADPRNAVRLLKILDGFDLTDAARSLLTPTLVLHGSRDLIQPLSDGRALASRIPGSELVVMEGKGHVPMMSSPDEVVSIVEKWIEERDL